MKKYILASLVMPLTASVSQAADFDVFFQETSSGVNWTGVVDTTTDTLSISQWTSGGSSLRPEERSLPIVFNAVTGASSSYDIPDNWDGNFTNWGFLSENSWSSYNWGDGSGDELAIDVQNSTKIGIGVIETYVEETTTGSPPTKDGGGGFTTVPAHYDRSYTNSRAMNDAANGRDLTPSTFSAAPVPVPEPSSALLLLVGATGALARRKR